VNAIEEIARQVIKLQKMTDATRGTTVTVGVVQGGTRSNVVPAEAVAEIDVRIASIEEAARVANQMKALKPELPGASLQLHGGIYRPPMERTTETLASFEIARDVAAQMGIDLKEGLDRRRFGRQFHVGAR
jgi:glutamate carboxypeptidase